MRRTLILPESVDRLFSLRGSWYGLLPSLRPLIMEVHHGPKSELFY